MRKFNYCNTIQLACTIRIITFVLIQFSALNLQGFRSTSIPSSKARSIPLSKPNFKQGIASFEPKKPSTLAMSAWACNRKSHKELVEKLVMARIIRSPTVKEALLRVDRANYIAKEPYLDSPQPIGSGQTISAPHMHAHVLEEFLPILKKISTEIQSFSKSDLSTTDNNKMTIQNELKILDVGCGSGYLTAAFGRMVDRSERGPIQPLSKGYVYGIDVLTELFDLSLTNMKKADEDLLASGTVTLAVGDGWKGIPSKAPFHIIHVGAAADKFPTDLMMQLYPAGGVMVIPVGPVGRVQKLYRVERLRYNSTFMEKDFSIKMLLDVRYVPLVRPDAR